MDTYRQKGRERDRKNLRLNVDRWLVLQVGDRNLNIHVYDTYIYVQIEKIERQIDDRQIGMARPFNDS